MSVYEQQILRRVCARAQTRLSLMLLDDCGDKTIKSHEMAHLYFYIVRLHHLSLFEGRHYQYGRFGFCGQGFLTLYNYRIFAVMCVSCYTVHECIFLLEP